MSDGYSVSEIKKIMSNVKKINLELLDACTMEKVDLSYIEELLKQGAQPLGAVCDSYGINNLYDAVVEHYLSGEEEIFVDITELFLKYGMDISKPEIPYDCNDVINPLWNFAFFSTEVGLKALKLLLDRGLDAESAGECWSHELLDWEIMEFYLEEERDYEFFYKMLRKIILIASYPHIIINDTNLQKEIWFSENDYDYTKFRNWDKYSFEIDTSYCISAPQANRSVVTIIEKNSGKKVWKFGFGISSQEVSDLR